VENHVERASGRLGALSRKGFAPVLRIQPTVGPTLEKFRPQPVDFGDKSCESADARGPHGVKLLAMPRQANKPQLPTAYYLHQTLFK
jgi:hypothetical protein